MRNFTGLQSLLGVVVAVSAVACSNAAETDPVDGTAVARSSLPRVTTPDVSAADRTAVSRANAQFARGLYGHVVAPEAGNAFFSPMSVSYALAMTWAGARGDTASEMSAALGFAASELDASKIHASLNALDLDLAARGKGAAGKDGGAFRLRIVNSVWGERTTTFEMPFLDTLATNYDAGIRLVDFQGASEPARTTINGWVSTETEGKIPELLPFGSVSSLTRLVLVNAVYFNGAWQYPFAESRTADAPFHAAGGDVNVSTMHVEAALPHATGETWEALAIPYADTRLQLVVIMPQAGGTLAALETALDGAKLAAAFGALKSEQIDLAIPKFKIDGAAVSLKPALQSLGMKRVFDAAAADLTGMRKDGGLYVSDVVHRAFIEIDEKGTEAAAATGVVVGTTSVPPPPKAVSVDRPFAFFLRDVPTDTVLFAGHVTLPKK